MAHNGIKMGENYNVSKTDNGKFMLKGYNGDESFEYAYDTVDELLDALRDDLTSGESKEKEDNEEPEQNEAKKAMKEITKKKDEEEGEDE